MEKTKKIFIMPERMPRPERFLTEDYNPDIPLRFIFKEKMVFQDDMDLLKRTFDLFGERTNAMPELILEGNVRWN